MRGSTHNDITLTVLQALEWKGDVKLAAKNAMWPDSVRSIEVEGHGCNLLGNGFAAFSHFLRPLGDGKFGGYCWKTDRSIPRLDITNRRVISHPEAWGFPVLDQFFQDEPLTKLLRDLTTPGHQGSIEADQLTFPTAAAEADWCWKMFVVWNKDSGSTQRQEALDILTGWIMHFIADSCVPHHADALLLDGHTAFEGDVDECWQKLKAKGTVDAILKTLVKTPLPENLTVRGMAEARAKAAAISPRKLGWYRCFWRPGWNRLVKSCVLAGLTYSVQLGKLLQKTTIS